MTFPRGIEEKSVLAHLLSLRLAQPLAQESKPVQIRDTHQLHLEYRSTGFHWRWQQRWISAGCTPSNLSSLLFSLRTHVPPEAKVLARQLTLLSDIAFATRMETTGMAYGQDMMAQILGELGCFLVEAHA
jgi:hypothetical protein